MVRGLIVVSRDEVSGLGHGQVVEIFACAPVAAHNLVVSARLVHIVDISGLCPEILTAFKLESPEPVLLSLGAILSIKLTSIQKNRRFSGKKFFNVPRVVD